MSRDPDREAVLTVAAYMPSIAIRVGLSYLRMKRRANKAAKRFYRELVRNGVPPGDARKLADEYIAALSLRHWARTIGGDDLPFVGGMFGSRSH